MARLHEHTLESAEGKRKEILEAVNGKFGRVPNIFGAMVNSPASVEAYFQLAQAIGKGSLSAAEREVVALIVSEKFDCHYCLAAHTAMARQAGLDEQQTLAVRRGEDLAEEKHTALAEFTRRVIETNGYVEDADVQKLRSAGYEDAAAVEVCLAIAQTYFTNLINHVHATEIDFPAAPSI